MQSMFQYICQWRLWVLIQSATSQTVSKVETLLSSDIKQLRKASTDCDTKSVVLSTLANNHPCPSNFQELAKIRQERDDITVMNQDVHQVIFF
jgi:hypothetical protein